MENTWNIKQIRDGETVEVTSGASREDALRAIRVAMYGEADAFGKANTDVHELPLAA
ncbi:MAG TPA: hypothetical protein VN522_02970 [Solirubrobacterales bacterium]|nr:hypothetical protein [Solirubrobacterales bacterium]